MISRRDFVKASALGSAALLAGDKQIFGNSVASPQPLRRLRFGVNYVPRKNWWYCWMDWDQNAVADDLKGVADLGLDHVRIQCLWPYFQPGINRVSESVLDRLYSLLNAADGAGLDVEVTVLNGWMSGLAFMPAWVAPLGNLGDRTNLNIFTSPTVIEAEKLLLSRIAETIGNHPRFLGFDIGNELTVLQSTLDNHATLEEGDAWAAKILGFCNQIAPGKFHVNGVDHKPWFTDSGFSRKQLAATGSASIVHSYPLFTGTSDRYKYSDPESFYLASYMIELAYAYHADLKRPVWVEETGAISKDMPGSYEPEFMEQTVRNIAATGKAWGVTWWCSHDIDPSIKGFSDLEYRLGLMDLNNRPKPLGRKFAELASELGNALPVSPSKTGLVIPDQGLSVRDWPPDWTYATAFMNLVHKGMVPAIVLESRSKDAQYLRARGITELIPLSGEAA